MMKDNLFNPPNSFIDDKESYFKFKQKFGIYMKATNYDQETDGRKIAIFLNVGGDVATDIYFSLKLNEQQEITYQNVITAFDEYYMLKKNELLSRYCFNTRSQIQGETTKDFIKELKELADSCDFGDTKDLLIRDRIIAGVLDNQLRSELLDQRSITLEQTEEICYSRKQEIQLKKDENELKKEEIVDMNIDDNEGYFDVQPINIECNQELTESKKREPVLLPGGLPPKVLKIVDNVKQAAENYKRGQKKSFFTNEVNSWLFSLEVEFKLLPKPLRSKVYDYLAQYVGYSKRTLIQRAKNLVQEKSQNDLNTLKEDLKRIIDQTMPALEMSYQRRSDIVLKQKFGNDKEDGQSKVIRASRRVYHWTDQSKNLLRKIWKVKKQCLILEDKQKDLEEQIVQYLQNDIKPLWPEGWMSLSFLKKICENIQEPTASNAQ